MTSGQACHVAGPSSGAGSASPIGRVRRAIPFVTGIVAAGMLVLLYLGIVSWAQGRTHALELLAQDRFFVGAIAGGFGLQVGLYAYLRVVVHHGLRLMMPTAITGAGTGASSLAMVACCLHHVADVLPVLGLSGAAVFLNEYRVPFMIAGLAVNLVGVAVMLRVVRNGRRHLRRMQLGAGVGMA